MAHRQSALVRESTAALPCPPPGAGASFGELLRYWRARRHESQLGLALAGGVSARHVSFLETGRARPSTEMVSRLTEALRLPLRERNALFVAAGFVPRHDERPMTAPALAAARHAVEFILNQQEPFPAFVLSRHWDLVMRNRASERVFGGLLRGRKRQANIMRSVFDDEGLRPLVVNWDEVALDMLAHLENQVRHVPSDAVASALLREILTLPNVPARAQPDGARPAPLLTAIYAREGRELRFFSTLATFGTPNDVTLEELCIECMFPADDATREFCRALAAPPS